MKTKALLCVTAIALLAVQGCKKNEAKTAPTTGGISPSKQKESSAPSSYGTFQFTNVYSNLVMETRGDSTLMHAQSSPANVQQYANYNTGVGISANQKWYLIQQNTGTITSSTPFKIMNVENGLFLEAPNGTSGTQLFDDHTNGFPSQIWYLHQVSGQSYYYIANSNGLVITDHGNSTSNGSAVTEETLASTTNQYWNLGAITNEGYRDDAVVTFFHRGNVSNTTVAFDQGNSIPLTNGSNNGKVLWITEDAYINTQLQSNGQLYCQVFSYHNSGLLQPTTTNWTSSSTPNITTTSNSDQGTGISNTEIIASPGNHNTTYKWPGVGVEIGSNVYVYSYEFYDNIYPTNQGLYQIAESTSSTAWGAVTRLTPNGMSNQITVGWSVGMIKKSTNDTVYVYGSKQAYSGGAAQFNTNNLFLARYPTSSPTTWTFWHNHSWSSTLDTTSASFMTIGSGQTTQANAGVAYVNGKYVLMQMDLGYFCDPSSHGIYTSTSTSPTGPFSTPKLVYTI
jgi:hypothetical protein